MPFKYGKAVIYDCSNHKIRFINTGKTVIDFNVHFRYRPIQTRYFIQFLAHYQKSIHLFEINANKMFWIQFYLNEDSINDILEEEKKHIALRQLQVDSHRKKKHPFL